MLIWALKYFVAESDAQIEQLDRAMPKSGFDKQLVMDTIEMLEKLR